MLVEALRAFHSYYGDDFQVECPVGSGKNLSLRAVADFLSARLVSLFRRDGDDLLFYEYFHGETGQGLGASHQTGWTALIVCLLDESEKK
jgi:hypothetical protein